MNDSRNIVDCYKGMPNEQIIADLETKKMNFGILLVNTEHDLNLGNVVRSANAFGAREVILYGKKHYDRRACCGAYKYLKVRNAKTFSDFNPIVEEYDIIIGVDNNVAFPGIEVLKLDNEVFYTDLNYLLVFGSESSGIPVEIGQCCDYFLEIPQIGSVRSLNLATAAGIVMFEFMRQIKETV